MRRPLIVVLWVLAGFAVVIGMSLLRRPHEVIPWRTDFALAQAESRSTGKPMLLDFSAGWCEPCQDMRRTTWSDPAVARALQGYVPVQIDHDARPDLVSQFGVAAIPHLTVVAPDGALLGWEEGELSADEFRDWLAAQRPAAPTTR